MSNPITKTIMESDLKPIEDIIQEVISDGENAKFNIVAYRSKFKSHLLQSQIKVIEAVIEEMKSKLIRVEDGKDALEQFGIQWLNKPIEDQISSLNETLEFLKKSL